MIDATPPAPGSPTAPKTSALAIWSLVLGILSFMPCFWFFAAIPAVICGHLAVGRIKHSSGALGGQGLAIAGLVTGYIGLAFAILILPIIAVPNFLRARATAQKNVCVHNLRIIDDAKQHWALDNKKQATDVPTAQDLAPYLPKGFPLCPAAGAYSINAANTPPTCSIPEHVLDQPAN